MPKFYTIIDHTADIGIKVTAKSLEQLYVNAARAMMDLMVGADTESGGAVTTLAVVVDAIDRQELLVKWLQEVHYLFDVKHQVPQAFRIRSRSDNKLIAEVDLKIFDHNVHEIRLEIKAVTYHKLRVEEMKDGTFEAEVIFDI